jgi:anti-sigma regulatory factor (Ser/Thr protein kinase)
MCRNQSVCETALAAEVVSVPRSRRHLRAWLDSLGWPPDAREDVLLAVGEAVTNAIEHSGPVVENPYPSEPVVEITASVEVEDRSRHIRVRVADHGRWREPSEDPERCRFGIPFMFEVMDEVSILRHHSGTHVTLLSPPVPGSVTAPPQQH